MRLVDFLLEASSLGVDVKPKDAAKLLGYDTRRLYEVINTLKAMDLIERNDGKIRWFGETGSETAQSKEYLSDLIRLMPNGLATASFAVSNITSPPRFEERLLQYNVDVMRAEIREDLMSKDNTEWACASYEVHSGEKNVLDCL